MAYDEHLADRVRLALRRAGSPFEEKKMMGGIAFMVDGKMAVGVVKDQLMARVGPEAHGAALERPGCREMDLTGRPMKGHVLVGPEGTDDEEALQAWVRLCLAFNPMARSSRRK